MATIRPRRIQRGATLATQNATGKAMRKHTADTARATPTVRTKTHTVSHTSGSQNLNAAVKLSVVNSWVGFWVLGSSL